MGDSIPQKVCTSCEQSFPATLEYFHACARVKCGLRNQCKECRSASGKAYRETNKAQDLARKKEYQQKHKEQGAACVKRYRDKHKDRVIARKKRYRETHLDQYKAQCRSTRHNRRARIRKAEGKHTTADVRKQYERQKGRCYYCKVKVGTKYQVDHVIPLAKGGSNGPENLVIACPTCNHSKHDKI